MCNLSQKEGGSLFAVLAKRQRKTLPKNLHLHVGQLCISFRPMEIQFIRQPHRLNKKCVNWKKTHLVGGGGHVSAKGAPWRPLGRHWAPGSECHCHVQNSPLEINAPSSPIPVLSLKFHQLEDAWRAFLSFKVKTNSVYLFTSR